VCGRHALLTSVPRLARRFGADPAVKLGPRLKIAPSQEVPVVRRSAGAGAGVFAVGVATVVGARGSGRGSAGSIGDGLNRPTPDPGY
jgi:putative SOS response-associated peptidase YedK